LKGAVILDTVSIALKQAEMMVALAKVNIHPSRQIGVFCKPEEDFEKESINRLASEFNLNS
jgi:hypothetical protein